MILFEVPLRDEEYTKFFLFKANITNYFSYVHINILKPGRSL